MKKFLICIAILSLVLSFTGCYKQDEARLAKDRESAENGLNRVLTVYDYNGKVIKTYEGKFDIEYSEGGKIKFDLDGKRKLIYNAVAICEEK